MTDIQVEQGNQQVEDHSPPEADWTVTQDRVEPADGGPRGRRTPLMWVVAVARRFWRWLTSMRTALILLFLLAIAAIPGSLLPQKNLNIEKVQQYYQQHPTLAPILERVGAFSVFASPWFSAIYLLLFVSLVGCLLPRLRVYYLAVRRVPPDAPARLNRMPVNASDLAFTDAPAVVASRLREVLRRRRYRTVVRSHDDGSVTVSAEKGYLKEAGNLLFHFSLMALLIGVAFGSWYGWHADRLLVQGADTAFCDTADQYDDITLGARMSAGDLEPFCLTLNSFQAQYASSGEPLLYSASASYTVGSSTNATPATIKVNDPLRLPKANVYLIGHGYAVVIKFTDKYGNTETKVAPFLPQDGQMTSTGAVVFPDANVNPATGSNTNPTTFVKDQVGFAGTYVPTASPGLATSTFPAENNPVLTLTPYVGDLGLDNGAPSSVYSLNQGEINSGGLKRLQPATPAANPSQPVVLKPGASVKLADGSSVQFVGTRPWVSLAVRYDPGEKVVLVGALLLVLGLIGSLTGRRRRVWFRVTPTPEGAQASAGGLARAEYASFPIEFASIVKAADSSATSADSESKAAQEERNVRGNALP